MKDQSVHRAIKRSLLVENCSNILRTLTTGVSRLSSLTCPVAVEEVKAKRAKENDERN
jgi:hypothetical protein